MYVGTWVYVSEGKGNVDQVGLQHIIISVSQHEDEDEDDDDDGARLSLSLSHTHTHTIGASHNSELRLNLLRLEGLTVSSLLWRLTYCSVGETEGERDFTYIRLHPSTADHLIILLSISFYTPLNKLNHHPPDRQNPHSFTTTLPHQRRPYHNNIQDVDHHHPLLRRPRRRQHVLRHALRRPKRRLSPTKARRKPTLPRRRRSAKSRRKLPIPHNQLLQRLSRRLPHRRFPRLLRRRQHAHQLRLPQRSSTPRLTHFHFSGIFPSRPRFATQHSL